MTAGNFSGNGASLTNLPAAQLTGAVPQSSINLSTVTTALAGKANTFVGISSPTAGAGHYIENATVVNGILTGGDYATISGGSAASGADGSVQLSTGGVLGSVPGLFYDWTGAVLDLNPTNGVLASSGTFQVTLNIGGLLRFINSGNFGGAIAAEAGGGELAVNPGLFNGSGTLSVGHNALASGANLSLYRWNGVADIKDIGIVPGGDSWFTSPVDVLSTVTVSGQDANGYSIKASSGINAGNGCILLQGGQICAPPSGAFSGGVVGAVPVYTGSAALSPSAFITQVSTGVGISTNTQFTGSMGVNVAPSTFTVELVSVEGVNHGASVTLLTTPFSGGHPVGANINILSGAGNGIPSTPNGNINIGANGGVNSLVYGTASINLQPGSGGVNIFDSANNPLLATPTLNTLVLGPGGYETEVSTGVAIATTTTIGVAQSTVTINCSSCSVNGNLRVSGQNPSGFSITVSSGINASSGCILLQGGQICGPASAGGGTGVSTQTVSWQNDNLVGNVNGSRTSFSLTQSPSSTSAVTCVLDGLTLGPADYAVTLPNTVSLTTAPAAVPQTTSFFCQYTVNTSTIPGALFSQQSNVITGMGNGITFGSGTQLTAQAGSAINVSTSSTNPWGELLISSMDVNSVTVATFSVLATGATSIFVSSTPYHIHCVTTMGASASGLFLYFGSDYAAHYGNELTAWTTGGSGFGGEVAFTGFGVAFGEVSSNTQTVAGGHQMADLYFETVENSTGTVYGRLTGGYDSAGGAVTDLPVSSSFQYRGITNGVTLSVGASTNLSTSVALFGHTWSGHCDLYIGKTHF